MLEPTNESSREDPLADTSSLSAHMLALIEIATVEERRTTNIGSTPNGERRRRTDEPVQSDDEPVT